MIEPGWEERAACKDDPDPGAWFATPGEVDRHRRAVAICLSCPVRVPCLEVALADGLKGTWGATSERERRKMANA